MSMRVNALGWGLLLTVVSLSVLIVLHISVLNVGMEGPPAPLYGLILGVVCGWLLVFSLPAAIIIEIVGWLHPNVPAKPAR